jgi:hypothetical protein
MKLSRQARSAWIILLIGFAALNLGALALAGLDGIASYLAGLGPIGVLATVDLMLALLVALVFVVRDASARGVDARPFVGLTVLTGSLGLLAYLARYDALPTTAVGPDPAAGRSVDRPRAS